MGNKNPQSRYFLDSLAPSNLFTLLLLVWLLSSPGPTRVNIYMMVADGQSTLILWICVTAMIIFRFLLEPEFRYVCER